MSNKISVDNLNFSNFKLMPSQIYGSIRLIPLVKENYDKQLKFNYEKYDALNIIKVDKNLQYTSYTPHAFHVSYDDDKQINNQKDKSPIVFSDKMIKKSGKSTVRFFPLHNAMESFLSLYFCGPDIIWEEYSGSAKKDCLSPRYERSISGKYIQGLEQALKIFEIYENQVGILLLVADKLTSVFILPNPQDYKVLHKTLVEDFFGDLIYYYGYLHTDIRQFEQKIDESKVNSLNDLKKELGFMKTQLADFYSLMAESIFNQSIETRDNYTLGKYNMNRFITDINQGSEHHIGEMIKDESGEIQYMKTYLLSDLQIKRAKVLKALSVHYWHLEKTADYFKMSLAKFILDIEKIGFGYIIKKPILEKIRKEERKRLS